MTIKTLIPVALLAIAMNTHAYEVSAQNSQLEGQVSRYKGDVTLVFNKGEVASIEADQQSVEGKQSHYQGNVQIRLTDGSNIRTDELTLIQGAQWTAQAQKIEIHNAAQ